MNKGRWSGRTTTTKHWHWHCPQEGSMTVGEVLLLRGGHLQVGLTSALIDPTEAFPRPMPIIEDGQSSWSHTTAAALLLQLSSHTVPHCP